MINLPSFDENFLAIEIGGTKLQIVAGSGREPGKIIDRRRFSVNSKEGGEGIRRQISEALPALIERWHPAAVSVGFGGPVDRAAGKISRSHQIEGWSGFDLTSWLQTASGIPRVVVDNDANMGALGEAALGAGKEANSIFYITLGSGVGGGFVTAGAVYHGASPGESEIGHVRLDREGTIVEERCSGWAVDRKIRAEATGLLRKLIGEIAGGEARYLARALEEGDASAARILDETCDHLSFALSHVVHLLHPDVIALGGGLSLVGEPLRRRVADRLPKYTMEVFEGTTTVRLAQLGEDAVPAGALVAAQLATAHREK